MTALITEANILYPDDLYQALTDLHCGLNKQQSMAANANLILLLSNHIGDHAVLNEAIDIALKNAQLSD